MLPADWSISTSHDHQGGGSENRTRFDLKYLSEEATRMRLLLESTPRGILWPAGQRIWGFLPVRYCYSWLLISASQECKDCPRSSCTNLTCGRTRRYMCCCFQRKVLYSTLNNVNAGRCGASIRECGCFCLPPPEYFCHPSSTTIVGLAHAYPTINCMGGTNFCAKSLHFMQF